MVEVKKCSRCKKIKLLNEFYNSSGGRDGKNSICRQCMNEYNKKRYQEDPEFRKRKIKATNNWKEKYPYKYWARQSLASHKRNGYKIQITTNELEQLVKETTHCFYCGQFFIYKGSFCETSATLDRIDNGKILTRNSVRIICSKCNMSKGKRTHNEFVEYCSKISKQFK